MRVWNSSPFKEGGIPHPLKGEESLCEMGYCSPFHKGIPHPLKPVEFLFNTLRHARVWNMFQEAFSSGSVE